MRFAVQANLTRKESRPLLSSSEHSVLTNFRSLLSVVQHPTSEKGLQSMSVAFRCLLRIQKGSSTVSCCGRVLLSLLTHLKATDCIIIVLEQR